MEEYVYCAASAGRNEIFKKDAHALQLAGRWCPRNFGRSTCMGRGRLPSLQLVSQEESDEDDQEMTSTIREHVVSFNYDACSHSSCTRDEGKKQLVLVLGWSYL